MSPPVVTNPYGNNPINTRGSSGGSPFTSGSALQAAPVVQQTPQQGTANPIVFPFYNAPSGQVPSPLAPAAQGQYAAQQFGLTNAPSQGDPGNIYDQLLAQLAQIQMPDNATLQQQAQQQAAAKYDPLIQQLQNNLGTAQTNEKAASDKIGGIYGDLGKALAASLPGITNQFSAAENQSRQNYANLQQQIQNNYQNAQAQQAAELQKLGIQAALPQSTQRLQQDQNYLTSQAANNGQSLNDALRTMGQGESDFAQRASLIAPMTGANTQSTLAQQLLQLQNQTNQQIAGYRGQEQSDAASLLSQLQAAAQKNYNDQQNQLINQTTNLAQLDKLVNPNAFGDTSTNSYKGTSGAAKYLADTNAANPAEAQNLVQVLNTFLSSQDNAGLTGLGGVGSPTVPQEYQALLTYVKDRGGQLSNQEMQQLYNALAIQAGKY